MENRFKLRISRMFRASFGSCRSRNVTDVIGKAVFVAENRRNFHLSEPLYPKIQTFPAMCRPRRPETMDISGNDCIEGKAILNRRKVSERSVCFVSGDIERRKCPPTSPISPFNSFCKFQDCRTKERKKKLSKKKNKKKEMNGWFSSEEEIEDGTDGGWFSSEDEIEDGTETFFFSKSFSSDSSELHRRKKKSSRLKIDETRRKKTMRRNYEMGLCPILTKGMVRDSFAVVKRSSDPHNDFRTSMVEMIIEKQIFAAKDLEQLLQCFLTLNSYHHHRIIVEVFIEIWEALFSNWP